MLQGRRKAAQSLSVFVEGNGGPMLHTSLAHLNAKGSRDAWLARRVCSTLA
jgi:hypothetical protein